MRYSDARFRGMLTPAQKDILDEYERCTKRVVTVDYIRLTALAQLAHREVTRYDVFLVVRYVRKRIRLGDNKHKVGTFTPASLEFGNLLGDCAKFEDRLQTARAEMAGKRVVNGRIVPVTVALGNGESITRLEECRPERAPEAARALVAAALRGILAGLETPQLEEAKARQA